MSTFELIGVSPPGIDHVLVVRKCLPDNDNERERNLQSDYKDEDSSNDGNDTLCPLRFAFHEVNKAFQVAK